MTKSTQVPLTARALSQRVDRALKKEGQALKAGRGAAADTLGALYVVDTKRGEVVAKRVDLEKLARKLGVIEAWERLENER